MSKSNSTSAPQTTSNTAYDDARVGVDGQGNRVLQDGSVDLGGGIFGGSAPIAAGSYQDTGDVFAPQFNLGGYDDRANAYDLYQNPQSQIYQPSGANIGGFGDSTPVSSAPPVPPASVGGDFAGAADRGATVTGGNVSGAVASGEGSISQQVGGGGAAIAGDNFGQNITAPISGPVIGGDVLDSPIINAPVSGAVIGGDVIDSAVVTAPVSGPVIGGDALGPVVTVTPPLSGNVGGGVTAPIVGGGDVQISGPVIQGNTAPVSITDASPQIAEAAFASTEATSKRALDLANSALSTVAQSVRDPSEKVSSDALKTLAVVAGVVGLLAYFTQKKAA